MAQRQTCPVRTRCPLSCRTSSTRTCEFTTSCRRKRRMPSSSAFATALSSNCGKIFTSSATSARENRISSMRGWRLTASRPLKPISLRCKKSISGSVKHTASKNSRIIYPTLAIKNRRVSATFINFVQLCAKYEDNSITTRH